MRLIRIISCRRVNCPRGEGLKPEKWDLPWLRCAAAALQLCPAFKEASGEVSVYPSDVGSSMRREELPMQGSCVARLHPCLLTLPKKVGKEPILAFCFQPLLGNGAQQHLVSTLFLHPL